MKRKCPYVPLHGLIHIERFPIRTHVDPVGGSHAVSNPRDPSVAFNTPDLPGTFLPVRITGEEHAIGRNGHIIWLAHFFAVRQHSNSPSSRIDTQNIVFRVIRNEHDSRSVKANSVRQAAVSEFDE